MQNTETNFNQIVTQTNIFSKFDKQVNMYLNNSNNDEFLENLNNSLHISSLHSNIKDSNIKIFQNLNEPILNLKELNKQFNIPKNMPFNPIIISKEFQSLRKQNIKGFNNEKNNLNDRSFLNKYGSIKEQIEDE